MATDFGDESGEKLFDWMLKVGQEAGQEADRETARETVWAYIRNGV